ncbi:MAG: sensor histidine kinase [Bryobacteraceae bacterium]
MRDTQFELRTSTARLLAGLIVTLLVIGAYAAYTLRSVRRMREMQTSIVERNRLASLQLIRIQNDLNSLGLSLRDMMERDDYPLSAWHPSLQRIHQNLDDAIAREAELSGGWRPGEQTIYLQTSFNDFWRSVDAAFATADDTQLRGAIRATLQPRQEALTSLVARLLVENNERDSQAAVEARKIYAEIERNAYLLLGFSVAFITITSLGLIRSNRTVLARLSALARERRELAQQLIATQESTFRSISRDLHDEFGQILTAVGALLRRAARLAPSPEFVAEVQEVNVAVQDSLEKIRSLSQSLQPVILEEQGWLEAVSWRLKNFERHTGIAVRAVLPRETIELPAEKGIHVYRIVQEALNNVARHSGANRADVRIECVDDRVRVTVEDAGRGIGEESLAGVGLAGMQERAELLGGELTIGPGGGGAGTRVRLEFGMPETVEPGIGSREALRGQE